MTVNFTGFKNAGGFVTIDAKGLITNKKIWAQLTDEDGTDLQEFKPLLAKYPDKQKLGFVRIEIPTNNKPLADSFISINDKSKKFDDLTEEDIPFVRMVSKLLSKISEPEQKLKVNKAYLDSDDALENLEVSEKDFVDANQKITVMATVYNPDAVKHLSKTAVQDINNKLVESFSK